MEELRLVLNGDIASNKNSLVARMLNSVITYLRSIPHKKLHDTKFTNEIVRGVAKHCRVTHTKKYKEWFEKAKEEIISQMEYEPFFEKVHIEWKFYFPKEGIAGGDITNKMQSVEDVLSACNVIDDDNYGCHKSGSYDSEYRKSGGGVELIIKSLV